MQFSFFGTIALPEGSVYEVPNTGFPVYGTAIVHDNFVSLRSVGTSFIPWCDQALRRDDQTNAESDAASTMGTPLT